MRFHPEDGSSHILSSSPILDFSIATEIARLPDGTIVDIGAGDGRLETQFVSPFPPGSTVIPLDHDPILIYSIKERLPGTQVIVADVLSLPLERSSCNGAVMVNVAHEVCQGKAEERFDRFRWLCENIARTLTLGGELVLFDGMMPEEEYSPNYLRRITEIEGKEPDATAALLRFAETYLGKELNIARIGEKGFRLSVEDLLTFFTKYSYISDPRWEDERRQLYPFLTFREMKAAMEKSGFELEYVSCPENPRKKKLEVFFDGFYARDFSSYRFPNTDILIHAKKIH